MAEEHFLVTGALGCIGAWVVRCLVTEGVPTTVFDLASDPHRLRLIMSPNELAHVHFETGDVTDLNAVERAIRDVAATHVIHLAGLQVPFCKADPPLGARVNVVGTVNVFEAVKRAGLRRVVYASSAAVYGPREEYPEPQVGHTAPQKPITHYGVYKQANEGTARIYYLDNGISSIGLRPYVVYGPGRDQGMTSSPTKAMLAAALGKSFHILFGGRATYQYAEDVARTFIRAARVSFEGAEAFNLRGATLHMREIVEAIEKVEPTVRGRITFQDEPLPYPDDFDDAPLLRLVGTLPETSLAQGVTASIAMFKRAAAEDRLPAHIVP